MSLRRCFTACALAGAVLVSAQSAEASARVAAQPSLQVSPQKLVINRTKVSLSASHLQPNTYYFILFAVPDNKKPKFQQIVGLARSDAGGKLKQSLRTPIMVLCGKAYVYIYRMAKPQYIGHQVTLTGCRAGKASGKLPPLPAAPPATPKKKKHH